jgi:ribonuclease BN (tRNA processing enzyme)
LAAAGEETVRYGGNTSCVEIRPADGPLIVLDAGTGIRKLGVRLREEPVPEVHLFLTHLHLDHLEGIGFFSPLWDPDVEFHIYGPHSPRRSLLDRVATLMSPPLFPVHVGEAPSNPTFHDVPNGQIQIGSLTITAEPVAHRGPTVGYRLEEGGRSLTYIPDHEPGRGIDLQRTEAEWISGFEIARDTDILLHDAQYSEEEYPTYTGWGHSSIRDTVSFAQQMKVRELVMFHHDPQHADDQLESMQKRVRELWGTSDPILAHEGMEIEL